MSRTDKPLGKSSGQYLENLQTPLGYTQVTSKSNKMEILLVIEQLIDWQLGDYGRLSHIYDTLGSNKNLYKSDEKYLDELLQSLYDDPSIGPDLESLMLSIKRESLPTYDETISNSLPKCAKCNNELKFLEETLQRDDKWFHAQCASVISEIEEIIETPESKIQPIIEKQIEVPKEESLEVPQEKPVEKLIEQPPEKPPEKPIAKLPKKPEKKPITVKTKSKSQGLDPIQITLAFTIFGFLIATSYYFLGSLSVIAMGLGGGLTIIQTLSARKAAFTKLQYGHRGPSVFMLFLLLTPFVLGTLVAVDGYSLWESPVRMFLLWGMTIAFWSTMLFVPMAVYSKYKEDNQPAPKVYPSLTALIPAFNEEKVIANTIEGLIETDYPNKEIIVIDDGSTDNTLSIANKYKNQVKVLHKENGGKATALNYGLNYAKGDIVVIVDADTIVGRHSLKQIIKGFGSSEHVAAVAGNIKVRNRINWFTKCQALEYITGIQIVRRAFDLFGAITIVPGALGAFKREMLESSGSYHKDTIVEDFDATVKILKSGLITQGSTQATAYTEAPSTLKDFVKQRKRWYRGNIQVLKRHADAITNPRYGFLQRLAFPYLIIGMLITPIIGFVSIGNAIAAIVMGDGLFVLQVFLIFLVVHYLMTALALRIDKDEPKLMLYTGFLVIGFKQIVDLLLLKAMIEHGINKKAVWTSASRTGI